MPYKVVGKTVYIKKGSKWRKKATAKSKASAKRMIAKINAWKRKKRKK